MVETMIPSYATENVNIAQFAKGFFTDKAITRNEDGTPKEDHTMRNVLIGLGVGGAILYHMMHKDDGQTAYQSLPQYQPQQTYQIPQQTQQPTYTQPVQQYQVPTQETYQSYEAPAPVVETQETSTPNEGVTITEF
jgi:hypothetical protein